MSNARNLIDELVSVDLIKTWSLIVTLLGDCSRDKKRALSGQQIRVILEHIGIKPEATRVALHRLKKDGWIDTSKSGREVFYILSKEGFAQTSLAYEDVYRETIKYPEGWSLYLNMQGDAVENSNNIQIFKNVFLTPKTRLQSDTEVMEVGFDKEHIPAWFEEKIIKSETLQMANKLQVLARKFMDEKAELREQDAFAIRVLFLHHWRKMALRNATWAHIWFFNEGPIALYHNLVVLILNRLSKSGEERGKHI